MYNQQANRGENGIIKNSEASKKGEKTAQRKWDRWKMKQTVNLNTHISVITLHVNRLKSS